MEKNKVKIIKAFSEGDFETIEKLLKELRINPKDKNGNYKTMDEVLLELSKKMERRDRLIKANKILNITCSLLCYLLLIILIIDVFTTKTQIGMRLSALLILSVVNTTRLIGIENKLDDKQ